MKSSKKSSKNKIIRREKNKIFINGLPEEIMKQQRKFEELIDDDGIEGLYMKCNGTFEVRYSTRKIAKKIAKKIKSIIAV